MEIFSVEYMLSSPTVSLLGTIRKNKKKLVKYWRQRSAVLSSFDQDTHTLLLVLRNLRYLLLHHHLCRSLKNQEQVMGMGDDQVYPQVVSIHILVVVNHQLLMDKEHLNLELLDHLYLPCLLFFPVCLRDPRKYTKVLFLQVLGEQRDII